MTKLRRARLRWMPARPRATHGVAGKAKTNGVGHRKGASNRPTVTWGRLSDAPGLPLMIDQAAARSPALISVGQSPFAIHALFVVFHRFRTEVRCHVPGPLFRRIADWGVRPAAPAAPAGMGPHHAHRSADQRFYVSSSRSKSVFFRSSGRRTGFRFSFALGTFS